MREYIEFLLWQYRLVDAFWFLEAEKTFNMGIGMVVIVAASDAGKAISTLAGRGLKSWTIGTIDKRADGELGDSPAKGGKGGAVTLVGNYKK